MGRYWHDEILDSTDLLAPDPSTNPTQPMIPYLYFDPERERLWIETRHNVDGTPADVWHNLVLRWKLDAKTDAESLTLKLRDSEIDPLLSRIVEGFSTLWRDGRRYGAYTEDARNAIDDVGEWLKTLPEIPGELAGLWDPADWVDLDDLPITADTTEEEVLRVIEELQDFAASENAVVYNLEEYVLNYWRELKEEARSNS